MPGTVEPIRPISDDEVDAFWRDGVVCLRGVLDPALLAAMTAPIDELMTLPEMADLTAMGDALEGSGHEVLRDSLGGSAIDGATDGATQGITQASAAPRRGRFVSGVDHWRSHDAFRAFACDSALPAVVGAVLRASRVHLWEDSVLVKEPGTRERTAWHQDLPYFHVTGTQLATTWCPLDPVTVATGAVRYVVGSHRDDAVYLPNLFVSTTTIPGANGTAVPDIDALEAAGEVEVVTFDSRPGDVIIHHARTLHGAGPNTSTGTMRRAISVRYCGDDARYHLRAGAPMKSHHHHVRDGDPLEGPDTPLVWTAGAS